MSKIVKGGPFGLFENPVCCKISKKLKGDPLETLKSCRKKTKNDHFEQSHSDEKCRRGALGFFNIPSVAKYQKKLKGDPLKTKKIRKNLIVPKKIERGDPLVSSGFVGYVKKLKMKGGVLWRQKFFEKKVAQCRKKSKGGTLSGPVRFCRLP